MKGGLGDLMKQAQKMQEEVQKAQQEIADLEVEGAAGAGMVKVLMSGQHELRRVYIDDAVFGDDKEVLEDLITAAVNDASQRVRRTTKEKMADATAGMPLPPGMSLPI